MVDLDADAHQYRLDEIKELEADIDRIKENCYEQYKRIEQLDASMRNILDAWDFWQSQECRNGFSELCVSIWDARALLVKKDKSDEQDR